MKGEGKIVHGSHTVCDSVFWCVTSLTASPLTPPPLPRSLTNLYRADTVGEYSDVIQLKVLPSLIKFCRKSMDIEVRIEAAKVLGACVRACVCACGCVHVYVLRHILL